MFTFKILKFVQFTKIAILFNIAKDKILKICFLEKKTSIIEKTEQKTWILRIFIYAVY